MASSNVHVGSARSSMALPACRSFGKVYQGWWRGGMVAIKVVPHEGDLGEKVEIVRESLLSSAIQHPQIVGIPPLASSESSSRNWASCQLHEVQEPWQFGTLCWNWNTLYITPRKALL